MHSLEEKKKALVVCSISCRICVCSVRGWEQTFESLRTLTIEETYELADAILSDDKEEISKEPGDLLLHVVFTHIWVAKRKISISMM